MKDSKKQLVGKWPIVPDISAYLPSETSYPYISNSFLLILSHSDIIIITKNCPFLSLNQSSQISPSTFKPIYSHSIYKDIFIFTLINLNNLT